MEYEQQNKSQLIIGNLLRFGVWSALAVTFLGGVLYLIQHGNEYENYAVFKEVDSSMVRIFSTFFSGLWQGEAEAILFLGIVLLFSIPLLRLAISLLLFYLQKDFLYVGITLAVILIIGCSMALGYAH
ncbi:DUF1634 domain-containing protein [Flavobacterium agrisoli]|uniref:DUF1634 domain-containing protein n=1 Tax=Flavobacterium agrisoli TaxID=2793066 RepID=A0A934PMP9_9FLAO|nr:DUF1634 domain-containing protein [Flavobacterium agrisoli]MBK0369306.1 DUF1634 domain-containing protein [Flavobacterium agrisoli]